MDERKVWIDPHHNETSISPKEARLRRAAKIMGFITAGVGLIFTLLACAGSFQSDWTPGLTYASVSCILRFFILWCALFSPLVGGVLLIIDGFLLSWFSMKYIHGGIIFTPLILLLVLTGILFILTWREHRKSLEASHSS